MFDNAVHLRFNALISFVRRLRMLLLSPTSSAMILSSAITRPFDARDVGALNVIHAARFAFPPGNLRCCRCALSAYWLLTVAHHIAVRRDHQSRFTLTCTVSGLQDHIAAGVTPHL